MKNLFIFIFLVIPLLGNTQEEANDYVMYHTIQLNPKAGHGPELMAGLKEHNATFHKEGYQQVNVWRVLSGENAGSLSWVRGPIKWSHMDIEGEEGHMDHWRESVLAHADMGEMGWWRRSEDLTCQPDGFQPKVMQIRWFSIKPEKGNNAQHLFGNIFNVYREMEMDMGLHVFHNQMPGPDGPNWGILWMHDSWSSMDKDRGFVAKYEEMYGEDSWDEFFEGWREATEFLGTQINVLIEDVSVGFPTASK